MKTLLIGGTNDGKSVNIPDDRNYWKVIAVQDGKPLIYPYDQLISMHSVIETEIYERSRMRGDNSEFSIFTIQGMTADKMIERLIDGYSPLANRKVE